MNRRIVVWFSSCALLACAGSEKDEPAFTEEVGAAVSDWTELPLSRGVQSPHPYTDNLSRAWTVEGPATAVQLQVHFAQLEVEQGYDKVFVGTTGGQRAQELTGTFTGWSTTIAGSSARVELVTDGSVTGYGFRIDKIRYRNTIVTDPPPATGGWQTVTLSTPIATAHPYPNNFDRTYTVQAAAGVTKLKLRFEDFDTEQGYDGVYVSDASGARVATYHGVLGDFTSAEISGNKATIRFVSDGSVTRYGFDLRSYEAFTESTTPPPPALTCGRQGCSGQICAATPVNSTCEWRAEYDCLRQASCEALGAACGFSIPQGSAAHRCFVDLGRCVFDADCGAGGRCEKTGDYGTCAATGGTEGDACSASAPCAAGHSCVDGICRAPLPGEGAACASDASCQSGLVCSAGFCVPSWMRGTFTNTNVRAIPDASETGLTSQLTVRGLGTVSTDVRLSLDIAHTYRGDLFVTLTNPAGTEVIVHDQAGGSADNLVLNNLLVPYPGDESANGVWVLKVYDLAQADTGTLRRWSLTITSRWD